MRAVRLLPLCTVLLLASVCWPAPAEGLPPAAKEALDAYEKEAIEVETKVKKESLKAAEKAAEQLKVLQDKYCKEAKLDEAVAIRDQIRLLRKGQFTQRVADLPPSAREVLDAFDKDVAEVQKSIGERLQKVRDKADAELKKIQDQFCKEEKLDEAIAVRDLRRLVKSGIKKARPDPGYLHATVNDIGKVWFFEVVGNTQGATYGTDVYTSDSHLGATTVHAGVLRRGQKGIVKVTILSGQNNYPSTSRNGVTSHPWSRWGVSFKVERLTGLVRGAPAPKE